MHMDHLRNFERPRGRARVSEQHPAFHSPSRIDVGHMPRPDMLQQLRCLLSHCCIRCNSLGPCKNSQHASWARLLKLEQDGRVTMRVTAKMRAALLQSISDRLSFRAIVQRSLIEKPVGGSPRARPSIAGEVFFSAEEIRPQHLDIANRCIWCSDEMPCNCERTALTVHKTIDTSPGTLQLCFSSPEHAQTWCTLWNIDVGLKKSTYDWFFGCAELLPLLRSFNEWDRDFESCLFDADHVVPRLASSCLNSRSRNFLLGIANRIEDLAASLRQEERRLEIPQRHVVNQILVQQDGFVERGTILARHRSPGQEELELKWKAEGRWILIAWEENNHVARLQRQPPTAKEMPEVAARNLQQQRALFGLRWTLLQTGTGNLLSVSDRIKQLENPRFRPPDGNARIVAQQAADQFPPGAAAPGIALSSAAALGLRVRINYDPKRHCRDTAERLLNGPLRWPGAAVIGLKDGTTRQLRLEGLQIDPESADRELWATLMPLLCEESEYMNELVSMSESLQGREQAIYMLKRLPHNENLKRARRRLKWLLKRYPNDKLLSHEIRIERVHQWCRRVGVEWLGVHPAFGETMYTTRNPNDQAASVQAVPTYVEPGIGWGIHIAPPLLKGFGADFDGDTMCVVNNLQLSAAEHQAKHFAPHSRLHDAAGRLVVGLSDFALKSWVALLQNPLEELPERFNRACALRILAASGAAARLDDKLKGANAQEIFGCILKARLPKNKHLAIRNALIVYAGGERFSPALGGAIFRARVLPRVNQRDAGNREAIDERVVKNWEHLVEKQLVQFFDETDTEGPPFDERVVKNWEHLVERFDAAAAAAPLDERALCDIIRSISQSVGPATAVAVVNDLERTAGVAMALVVRSPASSHPALSMRHASFLRAGINALQERFKTLPQYAWQCSQMRRTSAHINLKDLFSLYARGVS